MLDKKLTDSEIVKALEDWIKNYDGSYVNFKKLGNALDLINRLQAENEKLKNAKYIFSTVDYCADDLDKALKENAELKAEVERKKKQNDTLHKRYLNKHTAYCELLDELEEAKAEAYKEFAERLKAEYVDFDEENEVILPENLNLAIDDLLKEMVGEDNEKI